MMTTVSHDTVPLPSDAILARPVDTPPVASPAAPPPPPPPPRETISVPVLLERLQAFVQPKVFSALKKKYKELKREGGGRGRALSAEAKAELISFVRCLAGSSLAAVLRGDKPPAKPPLPMPPPPPLKPAKAKAKPPPPAVNADSHAVSCLVSLMQSPAKPLPRLRPAAAAADTRVAKRPRKAPLTKPAVRFFGVRGPPCEGKACGVHVGWAAACASLRDWRGATHKSFVTRGEAAAFAAAPPPPPPLRFEEDTSQPSPPRGAFLPYQLVPPLPPSAPAAAAAAAAYVPFALAPAPLLPPRIASPSLPAKRRTHVPGTVRVPKPLSSLASSLRATQNLNSRVRTPQFAPSRTPTQIATAAATAAAPPPVSRFPYRLRFGASEREET